MNVFVIDKDATEAARLAVDRHVVKMCLETAQILCTAMARHGIEGQYKPTHGKHPCVLWAGDSSANFAWLVRHGLALCDEYQYRYGRVHKCRAVIMACKRAVPVIHTIMVRSGGATEMTDWPQAMPDAYKVAGDAVAAYRNYYRHGKKHLHKWTERSVPEWIEEGT